MVEDCNGFTGHFVGSSFSVLFFSTDCAVETFLRGFMCVFGQSNQSNQERQLRKSETRINAELSDLDKSIVVKEALLVQIKEGQATFETMQRVRGSCEKNISALTFTGNQRPGCR